MFLLSRTAKALSNVGLSSFVLVFVLTILSRTSKVYGNTYSEISKQPIFNTNISTFGSFIAADKQALNLDLAQTKEFANTTVIEDSLSSNSYSPDEINLGGSYLESFFNRHLIQGNMGEEITIDLISEEFDTVLVLISPSGREIGYSDDEGINDNSRISLRLPESGEYELIVSAQPNIEAIGQYTLSWQEGYSAISGFAETEQLYQEIVQLESQQNYNYVISCIESYLEIANKVFDPDQESIAALQLILLLWHLEQNHQEEVRRIAQSLNISQQDIFSLEDALISTSDFRAAFLQLIAQHSPSAYGQFLAISGTEEQLLSALIVISLSAQYGSQIEIYETSLNYSQAIFYKESQIELLEGFLGETDPRVDSARKDLAELFASEGHYPEAEIILEGASSNSVNDTIELIHAFIVQGNYSEAEELLEIVMSISEEELSQDWNTALVPPYRLYLYGLLKFRQQDYAQAEFFLTEAIKLVAQNDALFYSAMRGTLALLYLYQGNMEEAELLLDEALVVAQQHK